MWLGPGIAIAVAATAPICPLAQEHPYATGVSLKSVYIYRYIKHMNPGIGSMKV